MANMTSSPALLFRLISYYSLMTLPSTHMEIHIVLQTHQNTESDSDDLIQMEPEIVFLIRSQQMLLIHRAHFSSKATGPIPILFLNYQQS